jgi:transposase InsO family protein
MGRAARAAFEREPPTRKRELASAREIEKLFEWWSGGDGWTRTTDPQARPGERAHLEGAVRGRKFKTTVPDTSAARPADLVKRAFVASCPNELWVADLTYVATWSGFVYVVFVVDVFARRIVGWRASRSSRCLLALRLPRCHTGIERRGPGSAEV